MMKTKTIHNREFLFSEPDLTEVCANSGLE